MYRIETWSETHSVSSDCPEFCSTESSLLRHRWKDSIILDFSSSPSLFWRSFLSSSQSELQNYMSDNIKIHPTFSQQFGLQNHCSVFQIHICICSSKIRINVRVLHVDEWYAMCCVFYPDSLVWQHFGTQPIQQLMGHLIVKPGYLVDMPEEQNTTSGLMGCHEQNKLRKQRNEKDRHKSRVRRKTWMVIPHNNCTWKRRYTALYFMGWGVQKCVVYLF